MNRAFGNVLEEALNGSDGVGPKIVGGEIEDLTKKPNHRVSLDLEATLAPGHNRSDRHSPTIHTTLTVI